MNIQKYITGPRSDFDNAKDEALTTPDHLETFLFAHRLSQLADVIMDAVKDSAIVNAELILGEKGGRYLDDTIGFSRTPIYNFDDNKLNRILKELTEEESKVKALKDSRKNREKELIDSGKAELVETKTSIKVSKK